MLLRGITGFSSSPDEQLPTLDKRSFSKTCYHFAQENRCKVLSINISVLEKNFYYAEFEKISFPLLSFTKYIPSLCSFCRKACVRLHYLYRPAD